MVHSFFKFMRSFLTFSVSQSYLLCKNKAFILKNGRYKDYFHRKGNNFYAVEF